MEQIAGPDESSWFASPIPSPTTCFNFPRCSYSAAIVCLSVPGILGVLRTFQSFPHRCHRDLGYNLYACMWGLGLCCMARSNCHRGRVQCHAPACARTSGIYQQDHQGPCHVHRCAVSRLCSEPGSLCQEHTPMQQQNCLARGESTSGLDMKASDSIGTIGRRVRHPLDIRDIGRIFGDPAGINIFSIFRAIFKDFGLHLALSGKS